MTRQGSMTNTLVRRRAVVVTLVLGVSAVLLAACTGGAPVRPVAGGTAAAPRPLGVQDPAVIPSAAAAATESCNPRASLRPTGTLPKAGQMPGGSTMATIAARGRLVVGVDQNTYLFGYRDPSTGQIVGFDIDVAKTIARAIFGDPEKVQLVAITSAQRIPFVSSGKVDIVADSMTINCARLQQVEFSTDYFDAGQKILVAKNSSIKSIDDLGGKKVCAAAGTTSIQTLAEAKSKPIPVAVNDWTDCMVMIQQGQVDAISTDDNILAGMAAQDPGLQVVGPRFTDEPHGLAIKKENTDFVRFVNGVLDEMRSDGTWASIYQTWMGAPVPAPPPSQYLD
jgi:polar amino acid transport system substrate-binding protein